VAIPSWLQKHYWRKIAVALIDLGCGGFECNGLWLLKKSIFLKTAEIWGIENV
jgi:hypothetical protein